MNQEVKTINGYSIKDEKAVRTYDSVASMRADTKLSEGQHVKTRGYYNINDGGSAEYYIVNEVSENDYKENLENGLYAKLIIEKSVNVDCFGAKGDGESDDSTAIQNAINSNADVINFSNKTYLLEDNIDLISKKYVGDNSTIKISNTEEREHFIRNVNFGDITKNDVIEIESINFTSDLTISVLGLQSATLIMNNCNLKATNNDRKTLIDLYGNNKNCIINNCNFEIDVEDRTKRGTCLEIRGFVGGKTDNILVSNCSFKQNTLDETLWINANLSSISNVLFDNCVITDNGDGANTIWVSNTATTGTPLPIKNIEFRKCEINKLNLTNRCITVGTREANSDFSIIDCQNVQFNNCVINVTERDENTSSGASYVFIYSKDTIDKQELKINNSIINYNGTRDITSLVNGQAISNNNIYKGLYCSYIFMQIYNSINDIVKECKSVARDCYKLIDLKATATNNIFNESNTKAHFTTSYLENSDVICNNVIANGSVITGRTYYVNNNKINNTSSLYSNYNGDDTNKLYLNNNFISNSSAIVGSAKCTLYIGDNYDSSGLLKGIFGNSYTLDSMVVGTTRFSNTATKTIVRKTTTGDTSASWEEI